MSQPAVAAVTSRAPGVARMYFWAAGLSAASALVSVALSRPLLFTDLDVISVAKLLRIIGLTLVFAAVLWLQGRWWRAVSLRDEALPRWTRRVNLWWAATVLISWLLFLVPSRRLVTGQLGLYEFNIAVVMGLALLVWWAASRWLSAASLVITQAEPARFRWRRLANNLLAIIQVVFALGGLYSAGKTLIALSAGLNFARLSVVVAVLTTLAPLFQAAFSFAFAAAISRHRGALLELPVLTAPQPSSVPEGWGADPLP